MRYEDAVYGSVEIVEPVLLDLLDAAAVRRLAHILQHGISGLIGVTAPITRLDHSLGAMLLVQRLGGSLTEQIAALLHDVSHTAFSHVIDYVFNDHDEQGYHERMKMTWIARSDLPGVLARHGYDWQYVAHEESFALLEQPAPALCADRLDYFLRDSAPLKLIASTDLVHVLAHLIVHQGRIAVDDLEVARFLADTFIAADEASWANLSEVGLYELTARAIRRGLEIGAVSEADLWSTDAVLWGKLVGCDDAGLQEWLRLVSPDTRFVWDDARPTFWVSTKIRTIDPDVLIGGDCRPLSAWDEAFAARRQDYLARKQGRWPIRVISAGQGAH